MPLLVCDRVETALMDTWALLESCLDEKAADLKKFSTPGADEAALILLNRAQYEKIKAVKLIGLCRGIVIPDDARFWREGAHNTLVIAWGEDDTELPPRLETA